MAKAKKCKKHDEYMSEVMGLAVCHTCTIKRLDPYLKELSVALKKGEQLNPALESIRFSHHLRKIDIVLMGWVWEDWVR